MALGKNYSTAHTLSHLVNLISESLDNGKSVYGIFVDFQKTFDIVDHEILLSKLDYYGTRGNGN